MRGGLKIFVEDEEEQSAKEIPMLRRLVLSMSNVKWFPVLSLFVITALILSACQSMRLPPPAPPVVQSVPTAMPAPATATPTPTPLPPRNAHLQVDQIVSQALEGNLLNDPTTRRFYVLLPPNYFYSEKHYPVVYVLPWGPGYAGGGFGGFETGIHSFLKEQPDKEMIFVSPDASNALGASLFRNSVTIGDYETYITQERALCYHPYKTPHTTLKRALL